MRNLYLAIIAILLLAEVTTMINWHQDVKELHDEIQYVYTELQEVRYNVSQMQKEYECRDTTDTRAMASMDETASN